MTRDYRRWHSRSLGKDMELLVFGHAGPPVVVFPSSMGAFFEYEDRGMVGALRHKLDSGALQLYCVSSVDSESWYAKRMHPRQRIERHLQYESYVLGDVVPLIRQLNGHEGIGVTGCSFGAYHAMAMALRHPYVFTSCVTMSGAFDISQFLNGYADTDAYLLNPPAFLPGLRLASEADGPVNLLVSPGIFSAGKIIEVRADAIQMVRLTGLAQRGSNFEWVTGEPL